MKKLIIAVMVLCLLVFLACETDQMETTPSPSDQDAVQDGVQERVIRQAEQDPRNPKFFSSQNAGKWKGLEDDHIPVVKTKIRDEDRLVKVTVPLKGQLGHYIETIVLVSHNGKELQSKQFDKYQKVFKAEFILPKDYRSYLYVVAKCNLHDMWRARADWDE